MCPALVELKFWGTRSGDDRYVHEGQVMTGTIVLGGSSRLNREKTGSWQILSQVGGQGYLVSQKVMCEERTR